MKTSTKKKLLIGAVAALCVTTVASVSALAVYTSRTLNQSNTIAVGQAVDTVVLGAGTNVEDAMYPGDTATITYAVDLDGHTADDVTVSWTLMAGETDVEANNDFSVSVTSAEEAVTESETKINDGELVFTITMNSELETPPAYSSVTLSVLLSVAGDAQAAA